MNWYFQVLRKYAVFSGRARRKEYWIFGVVQGLVIFGLKGLALLLGKHDPNGWTPLTEALYTIATFIPTAAVSVRRLHDTNRSGWWFLLFLVPLANLYLFFGIMTQDSDPGENRFGPNPKGEPTGPVPLLA
jgi:uncharacterized membrane protein YhaH (DUF805 family)